MDFVDGEWTLCRILTRSTLQPIRIVPLVTVEADYPGCGIWPQFSRKCVRIGLLEPVLGPAGLDGVLIERTFPEIGDECLPDARTAGGLHRILTRLPAIEVADHAYC